MNPSSSSARPMLALSAFKSLEDSNTLFDFDTPINEDNLVINSTAQIYRKKLTEYVRGKKLKVVTKQHAMNGELPDFDHHLLFSLTVKQNNHNISYIVDKPEDVRPFEELTIQTAQSLPFFCLNNHGRSNQVKSCPIQDGDLIRLGKTYLRVLQTHLSARKNTQLPQNINPGLEQQRDSLEANPEPKTCRICLMESDEDQDLISPCHCKGSCRYVHLSCLKIWFQNKINRQQNRLVASYLLSKFECELCKKSLPNTVLVKGKTQHFVQFRRPDEPYIVLEKLQERAKDKIIYVITPKDQPVRLGRGTLAELRFHDPTMSRLHSIIEFKQEKFLLTDMGSKFGSLMLLQGAKQFEQIACVQVANKLYKLQTVPSIHPRAYSYL